jgi:hypothetical protein
LAGCNFSLAPEPRKNMSDFLEKDHVRGLAYALQIVLGDEYFDEEIQTSVREMMEQWADSPSYARSIQSNWIKVLEETDPRIAPHLVSVWANKGDYSPEEAVEMLRQWYRMFQPLWDQLAELNSRDGN